MDNYYFVQLELMKWLIQPEWKLEDWLRKSLGGYYHCKSAVQFFRNLKTILNFIFRISKKFSKIKKFLKLNSPATFHFYEYFSHKSNKYEDDFHWCIIRKVNIAFSDTFRNNKTNKPWNKNKSEQSESPSLSR